MPSKFADGYGVGMNRTILHGSEVDNILRTPRGTSVRWAKKGKLPHFTLPNGDVRFVLEEIERWMIAASGNKGGLKLVG